MTLQEQKRWITRMAAAGIISLGAFGMVGCDTAGNEAGTDVEDVQEEGDNPDVTGQATDAAGEDVRTPLFVGPYDQAFNDEADIYVGEVVTVSANVNEIVTPMSFTIAGTDETTVDPLLIVHDGQMTDLSEGTAVEVTGTYQEAFDLPTVEENMDLDLEDDGFADHDKEPYIEATNIDTSVPAEE